VLAEIEGANVEELQPDKRLLREAFDLVVAVYDDPSRRPELDSWRKQSPAHERAAVQAEADWNVLGQVDDVPLSRLDAVKLAAQVRLARFAKRPLRPVTTVCVAMALVAVVYVSLDLGFRSEPLSSAVPVSANASSTRSPESYRTGRGQQRTVTLDDGSEVWMDWHTELAVLMTASERRVELLKGKALFSVAADPDRPFSVVSEGTVATVLGTEFVVYRLGDQAVEVQVLEGAVGVQPEDGQAATRLEVADVVRVTNGEVGPVNSRPLAEIGAWRNGVLVFEKRPLIEALETLEPYTSYQIDASYVFDSNRLVSGTFVLSKGDDALQAIMQSYRLIGEVEGRNTLVLRSMPPARPR